MALQKNSFLSSLARLHNSTWFAGTTPYSVLLFGVGIPAVLAESGTPLRGRLERGFGAGGRDDAAAVGWRK